MSRPIEFETAHARLTILDHCIMAFFADYGFGEQIPIGISDTQAIRRAIQELEIHAQGGSRVEADKMIEVLRKRLDRPTQGVHYEAVE